MTHDEAQTEAATLNAEHPDRDRFHWFVREVDGDWSVARVPSPGGSAPQHLTTSHPGKQPSPPDDHPTDLPGGVPPWAAGGG